MKKPINTTDKQKNKLTSKQKQILNYLLNFRHLQQTQIQQLMKHKHKERIRIWLNDLTDKQYIFKIFEKTVAAKPSEYCLDKKSISYLKECGTNERLLNRVYTEKTNSPALREHSLYVATLYLSLVALTKKTQAKLNYYTKDDLYAIDYLILPNPDCYFAITETNGNVARYFIDLIENEKFLYKRVHQYLTYYKNHYWQDHTTKPFPKIILICLSTGVKQRIKAFIIRHRMGDTPSFYLSTKSAIQKNGISKATLEKVIE